MVQRLKTMSTTGAIGQAASGSTSTAAGRDVASVTMSPSLHYFPLGTYYAKDGSFLFVREKRQEPVETDRQTCRHGKGEQS
ncbi:hypothetical protein GCM10023335_72670 [Streptomyces siamensis]|uniref:Uncharacterized protein n=1 Tax=Streptomyces siamensis TaxID=1274986 RepID=A0ABP9JHG4_9ACTN